MSPFNVKEIDTVKVMVLKTVCTLDSSLGGLRDGLSGKGDNPLYDSMFTNM